MPLFKDREDRINYLIRKTEEALGSPLDKETIANIIEQPDEALPYLPGMQIGPELQLFVCTSCGHLGSFSEVLPVCPCCGDNDGSYDKR